MIPEDDEADFVSERIQEIAKNAVSQVLGDAVYSSAKSGEWCTQISDNCLKELTKLNKPFKFLVTCILMQKSGAGLCTAATCFWDSKTDGLCSLQVNGETFDCIVTVYMCQI